VAGDGDRRDGPAAGPGREGPPAGLDEPPRQPRPTYPPPPPLVDPGAPPPPLSTLPPPPGPPAAPRRTGEPGPLLDRPEAPPVDRPGAALWLVFAVVGFAVGQIGAAVAAAVAASIAGKSHQLSAIARMSVPPEWYVVATLVGLWVGFFGAPWLASRVRGTGHLVADLGLSFRWIDLVGIVIGVGGQIVVSALYAPFIHHLKNFNAPTQRLTGAAHGGGFVVIALFTVIGAPFFEELFFRGLLFRGLVRFFSPARAQGTGRVVAVVGAVVVDGVLFGLAHGEWEQLAGLALFGMALAWVSYRTGRLGMNIVAHASFNLVAILALASTGGGLVH
jgi:membrane protease YdiL (CAAX protease family)